MIQSDRQDELSSSEHLNYTQQRRLHPFSSAPQLQPPYLFLHHAVVVILFLWRFTSTRVVLPPRPQEPGLRAIPGWIQPVRR